jgi:hypothetical protein
MVRYQRFGGPCCLHLQGVTPCSVVVGYQRFGGSCCLHLQDVTPCSNVVGYQRFGGPCCLLLQVVTPCSYVVGYQRFGVSCCLHLQATRTSETFVSYHITTRCQNPKDLDLNLHRCENVRSCIKNSLVRFSYRRASVQNKVFCCFPQAYSTNSGILP